MTRNPLLFTYTHKSILHKSRPPSANINLSFLLHPAYHIGNNNSKMRNYHPPHQHVRVRERERNDALPEIIRYLSNNLFAFNPGVLLCREHIIIMCICECICGEKVRKADDDVADEF